MNELHEYEQIIYKISLLENNQQQILSKLKKIEEANNNLDIIEDLLRLLITNQFLTDIFKENDTFKLLTNKDIRDFAERKQIKLPKKAKKSEMIHIIQKAEGNLPCYSTKSCINFNCFWYRNCQKEYINNYI